MAIAPTSQPTLTSRICWLPGDNDASAAEGSARRLYHVFFIPGNPGCIEYYHGFLSLLAMELRRSLDDATVSVYGISLANFVDGGKEAEAVPRPGRGILGLGAQIAYVEGALREYVRLWMERSGAAGPAKVILVGHSVGAYMGLEVLRGLREERTGAAGAVEVVGYVGLWPTVTWIKKSSSGRKASWLLNLPYFARIAAAVVRLVLACISASILIELVTGFPKDAAKVTGEFLQSEKGVEQSLYMARDEMNEITEDRWDRDVWGAAEPEPGRDQPNLVFYFGTDDHWVADHARDELIAARGRRDEEGDDWKPVMLVDQEEIPHAFCIRHSGIAATKSAAFLRQIISKDQSKHGR